MSELTMRQYEADSASMAEHPPPQCVVPHIERETPRPTTADLVAQWDTLITRALAARGLERRRT